MVGGQEGAIPVLGPVTGVAAVVGQHHEGGQIIVQATQPVADPGPHARETGILEASGLQVGGLAVHAGLAGHVVDEGHLVDHPAERRDRLGQQFSAGAVGPEFPYRLEPGTQTILEGFDFLAEIRGLTVTLFQLGLVVEQVDVAGGPGHKKLHHTLGLGLKHWAGGLRGGTSGPALTIEHCRQGDSPQATSGTP